MDYPGLDNLIDVEVDRVEQTDMHGATSGSAPSDGDVLTYSAASSKWINQAPSGGGGGVSVTVGPRASLPGSGTNIGDTYICSDTDYTYVWSGSLWNASHGGGYVNDPSIDSTFARKVTNTVTGDSIVTTFGGARLKDGSSAAGQLLSYVKPVTPSSTLKIRIGFQYGLGAFKQGGPCVYNSNTGKWIFFCYAGGNFRQDRYTDTAGYGSTVTTVTPLSVTMAGTGVESSPAPNPHPFKRWCLDFDGTDWYLRLYQDAACQCLITTVFSEALATWIGTNFTHVGIGINPVTGDSVLLEDLTVLHT